MAPQAPTRAQVMEHLGAFVACMARWQARAGGDAAGGLPCPVARIPQQWTELFALPVAVDAIARDHPDAAPLARGLVDFVARWQREDGTWDAGFCGDLAAPCNAAFALRPLATALEDGADRLDGALRERLSDVLARAAHACVEGGMNTANHRWVAAGGLAHAARALDREDLARAADDWTSARIDIDGDGAFSEGSPKYALVSCDAFLDLEALQGRRDLGDLARRCLGYLRATTLPGGEPAAVGSVRYDTDGSSDGPARAAFVFARLGAHDLAALELARLWALRSVPGLLVACGTPPLGAVGKAKLYPSVVSALAADSLLRWLRLGADAAGAPSGPESAGTPREPIARDGDGVVALRESGLAVHRHGDFAVAASARGPNLLEIHAGEACIEGARLLGHATGWNPLFVVGREIDEGGLSLRVSSALGEPFVRLPQFHRDAPEERRLGAPVAAIAGTLRLRLGPGPRVAIELDLDGPARANALLELALRPDQSLFDADGVRHAAGVAAGLAGRHALGSTGPHRLVIDHEGASGHALQVAPYGYGSGDDLWSPSFAGIPLRFGVALPARLRVHVAAA